MRIIGGPVLKLAAILSLIASIASAASPNGQAPAGYYVVPNEVNIWAAQKSRDEAAAAMRESYSFGFREASLNTIRAMAPEELTNWKSIGEIMLADLCPDLVRSLRIDLWLHPNKETQPQDLTMAFAIISSVIGSKQAQTDSELFTMDNPNQKVPADALVRVAGYIKGLNLREYVLTQEANKQATHQPLDRSTFYWATRERVSRSVDRNVFQFFVLQDKEAANNYYSRLNKEGRESYDRGLQMIKVWTE